MIELIIIVGTVLFLAAVWNHSKARYWKKRSKDLFKAALEEHQKLTEEIRTLKAGRS